MCTWVKIVPNCPMPELKHNHHGEYLYSDPVLVYVDHEKGMAGWTKALYTNRPGLWRGYVLDSPLAGVTYWASIEMPVQTGV